MTQTEYTEYTRRRTSGPRPENTLNQMDARSMKTQLRGQVTVAPTTQPPAKADADTAATVVVAVAVMGDLDYETVADFSAETDRAFSSASAGLKRLVVDCRKMTFCDSSGLSLLMLIQRRAKASGARMVLAHQPDFLRALLDVTGTSLLFDDGELSDDGEQLPSAPSAESHSGSIEGHVWQDAVRVPANDGVTTRGKTDMYPSARVHQRAGHPIVDLVGAIDLECADEVREALETATAQAQAQAQAADPAVPSVIVNVQHLTFADSTMLHLLLQAKKQAAVHLAGPLNQSIELLLDVAGVADQFPQHPGIEEAVQAVQRSPSWKRIP